MNRRRLEGELETIRGFEIFFFQLFLVEFCFCLDVEVEDKVYVGKSFEGKLRDFSFYFVTVNEKVCFGGDKCRFLKSGEYDCRFSQTSGRFW